MVFFFAGGRIFLLGVIHARLRLSKNTLLVWMILLLGKEHITLTTSSVLNAVVHFWSLQCLFQILKVEKFIFPLLKLINSHSSIYFIGEVELIGDGEFEGFTVYKGHPYCETCHVRLRLPKCKRCKRSIRDHDEVVEALGGKWCWGCFVCAVSSPRLFFFFYCSLFPVSILMIYFVFICRPAMNLLKIFPFSRGIISLSVNSVLVSC